MPDWPADVQAGFPGDFVPSANAARFYSKMMDDTYTGNLNAWGLAWMYTAWKRRALSIAPAVNLISNIGFGPDATHTRKVDPFAALPTSPMPFPLVHPEKITANTEADLALFKVRRHRRIPQLARMIVNSTQSVIGQQMRPRRRDGRREEDKKFNLNFLLRVFHRDFAPSRSHLSSWYEHQPTIFAVPQNVVSLVR